MINDELLTDSYKPLFRCFSAYTSPVFNSHAVKSTLCLHSH